MNRYSMRTIFLPAYLWTPIGSSLACGFMYLTGLLPTGYRLDIFLLAILSSTVNANARFLLGKDNIKGFNLTFILQGGLLFFVLCNNSTSKYFRSLISSSRFLSEASTQSQTASSSSKEAVPAKNRCNTFLSIYYISTSRK
jgi:hypothetical protein